MADVRSGCLHGLSVDPCGDGRGGRSKGSCSGHHKCRAVYRRRERLRAFGRQLVVCRLEKIEAFYVQFDLSGTVAGLPWSANIGGRYVHTKETSHGYTHQLVDLLPIQGDPSEFNPVFADNGQLLYVSASHSYNNFLPSANFKLNITDQIIARAAVSRSLTRPDMYDLRPVINYNVLRPGEMQASGGSPDLRPYLSDNYDLFLEWYYSRASYATNKTNRKNNKNNNSNAYTNLPQHIGNSQNI